MQTTSGVLSVRSKLLFIFLQFSLFGNLYFSKSLSYIQILQLIKKSCFHQPIKRKQGVPHDIWVRIKERVDLVRKYNLKPRAPRENQLFIQDELTQLDGQIESLDKDVCSNTDFQNDTGVENCKRSSLTFTQLLRHFSARTNKKQNHLTYLLTLLKVHEPLPDYSLLPNIGKELIKIDGLDFPASINDPTHKKLSEARLINDGKS
ncbi:Uncharacterized protein APZ42_007375, partial [Daphnia magna]